jgi:hypothetical protein
MVFALYRLCILSATGRYANWHTTARDISRQIYLVTARVITTSYLYDTLKDVVTTFAVAKQPGVYMEKHHLSYLP